MLGHARKHARVFQECPAHRYLLSRSRHQYWFLYMIAGFNEAKASVCTILHNLCPIVALAPSSRPTAAGYLLACPSGDVRGDGGYVLDGISYRNNWHAGD
jgi:hypothetical protein